MLLIRMYEIIHLILVFLLHEILRLWQERVREPIFHPFNFGNKMLSYYYFLKIERFICLDFKNHSSGAKLSNLYKILSWTSTQIARGFSNNLICMQIKQYLLFSFPGGWYSLKTHPRHCYNVDAATSTVFCTVFTLYNSIWMVWF